LKLDPNQHYLRNALALAIASRAAYLNDPQKDAEFSAMGWNKVKPIDEPKSHTQCFVASNDEDLVVAFRGTEPNRIEDWLTDLCYEYFERPVGGGSVHGGFWRAWLAVKSEVVDAVKSQRKMKQNVWVTGHSLGGALACLAGADLPAAHKPVSIHTFGGPRVGSPEYAKGFKLSLARYVNNTDIVPHVPLQGLLIRYRYSHVGLRKIIQADGSVTSSEAAWLRLLRLTAQSTFMGLASVSKQAFANHSLDEYIAKLSKHHANRQLTT